MPEDLFIEHIEDLEVFYERAAGYTGMAERTVEYVKMEEGAEQPEAFDQYSNLEEAFNFYMKEAADNFERALDSLHKNNTMKQLEKRYENDEPLLKTVTRFKNREPEYTVDSTPLLDELERFEKIKDYAEENDVTVENLPEFISYDGEDAEILE